MPNQKPTKIESIYVQINSCAAISVSVCMRFDFDCKRKQHIRKKNKRTDTESKCKINLPQEKFGSIVTRMGTKKYTYTCTSYTRKCNATNWNHLKYNIRNVPIIVLVPNKFSLLLSAVAWIDKWFLFSCRMELAAISNTKSHCLSTATQIAVFDILYALMLQVESSFVFSVSPCLSPCVCGFAPCYIIYANWLLAKIEHTHTPWNKRKKKNTHMKSAGKEEVMYFFQKNGISRWTNEFNVDFS